MAVTVNISIGQLAERTGLSVSAIRYYETQGLLFSERSTGGGNVGFCALILGDCHLF